MSEIKTTDFDGIKLSEYQGKYSIEALRAKDEKFFPVWAKYQKGRDEFQEKSWPVKVVLGDKESAIVTLKTMLDELEAQSPLDTTPF
jgi:hypothetical protein